MRTLPEKLNDGTYDYKLVRQEEQLPNGLTNTALYERVPIDPDYQYTPDLAYRIGKAKVATMVKLLR